MKTTVEIPDDLFRDVKAAAARQGRSLKSVVTEALADKMRAAGNAAPTEPPWRRAFGGLRHLRQENARIRRWIEEEFERIEPEDLP